MFMRKYSLPTLVGLIFIGVVLLVPHLKKTFISVPSSIIATAEKEETVVDNEEELVARIQQEIQMTKDPALGYVPTERLTSATQVAARLNKAAKETDIYNLTWTERGPNNLGGRTRSVLIDQTDATGNTVLAGSAGGGLWRTTDF